MPTAHQPLVLVVDDEAPIRQMEMRILQKGGYRVAEAASGPEAIKMLEDGLVLEAFLDKPFTANGLLEAVSLLLTGTVTGAQ